MAGNELFMAKAGKKRDAAIHDAILDNAEAEREIARAAVSRAIERGVTPEDAERMFGGGRPG